MESALSLCSRAPRRKASVSTGAASSRGSMADAKRFMKASYLGKAWNRTPSRGPVAQQGTWSLLCPPCCPHVADALREPPGSSGPRPSRLSVAVLSLPVPGLCRGRHQGGQSGPGQRESHRGVVAGTGVKLASRQPQKPGKYPGCGLRDKPRATEQVLLSLPSAHALLRGRKTAFSALQHADCSFLLCKSPTSSHHSRNRSAPLHPTSSHDRIHFDTHPPPLDGRQELGGCLCPGGLIFIFSPELLMFGSSRLTVYPRDLIIVT